MQLYSVSSDSVTSLDPDRDKQFGNQENLNIFLMCIFKIATKNIGLRKVHKT